METTSQIFRVDRREINYLRVTIESYDGMAVVSTIDPQEATIQLQVSPGCEGVLSELVRSLRVDEGVALIDLSQTP